MCAEWMFAEWMCAEWMYAEWMCAEWMCEEWMCEEIKKVVFYLWLFILFRKSTEHIWNIWEIEIKEK